MRAAPPYTLAPLSLSLGLLLLLLGQAHVVLASGAAATYDGLRQLTSANFTLTQQGAWLIEFFSPLCIHCKQFGPTWSELNQNKDFLRTRYPEAPFTLAQVNCIAQRDLCSEQGVQFLPRLTIYQDGVQHQGEYKGNRNYAEISAYIDKHASDYRAAKGVAEMPPASDEATAATAQEVPVSSVSAPPSPTPSAAAPAGASASNVFPEPPLKQQLPIPLPVQAPTDPLPEGPNPKGELISYGGTQIPTPEALAHWIEKGSGQGPTFVKFFAPWCPHCKAMAAAFEQLASSLKGRINVLEVNCEEHKALCGKYKISGYPTLRMYNDGKAIEYSGGRNHDSMLKWASKAGSILDMKPIESVGDLAKVAKTDEVFFVYLHSPATAKREIEIVDEGVKALAGTRSFAYGSSDVGLTERYADFLAKDATGSIPSTSALLVFKDHSVIEPTAVFHPSTLSPSLSVTAAAEKVSQWIREERWPLVTEITGANFKEVIDNDVGALTVVAALSDVHHHGEQTTDAIAGTKERDRELMALRSLSLSWRQNEVSKSSAKIIWAWIDADRWTAELKRLYKVKTAQLPHLLLVDGAQQEYFDLPSQQPEEFGSWTPRDKVFATIADAVGGRIQAKNSRSMLDRGIRGAAVGSGAIIHTSTQHPLPSLVLLAAILFCLYLYLRDPSAAGSVGGASTLPLYSKPSAVKTD